MYGQSITAFEFVNLKSLGKSPMGHFSTTFLAIALESGLVRIYDTFLGQSLLFEFTVPLTFNNRIVQVASSTVPDDMQLSVLTSNGLLYVYEISLERKLKLQQRELENEEEPASEAKIGDIRQGGRRKNAKRESKKEDTSSNRYQNLLKIYQYRANQPIVYDLTSYRTGNNTDEVKFENLMVYAHKGDHLIIVTDSEGFITIMYPKKQKSNTMHYEFKSRIYSGISQSILSLARHQQNVLFLHKK